MSSACSLEEGPLCLAEVRELQSRSSRARSELGNGGEVSSRAYGFLVTAFGEAVSPSLWWRRQNLMPKHGGQEHWEQD